MQLFPDPSTMKGLAIKGLPIYNHIIPKAQSRLWRTFSIRFLAHPAMVYLSIVGRFFG